jgi:hypothetical protein
MGWVFTVVALKRHQDLASSSRQPGPVPGVFYGLAQLVG